jgi:signal transduction histidine kinase
MTSVVEVALGDTSGAARRRALSFGGLGSRGTRVVVLPVCIGAAVVVGLAIWGGGVGDLVGPAAALLVVATLAEAFPVPIEGVAAGATSFANVFIVTAAVVYGWQPAALIGAVSMIVVEAFRRKPLVRLAYNAALYALAAAAAGIVTRPIPEPYRIGVIGSLCFYAVDLVLLSAVLAQIRGERYSRVAAAFFLSTLAPFVVMAATTGILVQLWRDSPWYGLLLAPPIIAIGMYQRSLLATVRRQRELDKLKDEFIAVISHELRTPLASVYGAAVTLEERTLDDEMQRRLIDVVRRESTRLTKVVNDVLWASRLGANKVEGRPQWCDGAALVQEVAETANEISPSNLEIVVGDKRPTPVLADPDQLRMVLAYLVDNAVKYSPGGGTVEIRAEQAGNRVRFSVSDQGLGIPAEERERVFEKYIRLDPDMRRGIGGTGLGLYICRELVAQMGGGIWVTDNQPRGSRFAFEIPASQGGAR